MRKQFVNIASDQWLIIWMWSWCSTICHGWPLIRLLSQFPISFSCFVTQIFWLFRWLTLLSGYWIIDAVSAWALYCIQRQKTEVEGFSAEVLVVFSKFLLENSLKDLLLFQKRFSPHLVVAFLFLFFVMDLLSCLYWYKVGISCQLPKDVLVSGFSDAWFLL